MRAQNIPEPPKVCEEWVRANITPQDTYESALLKYDRALTKSNDLRIYCNNFAKEIVKEFRKLQK